MRLIAWVLIGKAVITLKMVIFYSIPAILVRRPDYTFWLKYVQMSLAGSAQMVSRTIILTQENTPAIFDNSTTFYTQVRGERIATLESANFGTMISVIPRPSPTGDEIEMVINLEDHAEKKPKAVKPKKSMHCR